MNNQEIINNIKAKLTKDKSVDVPYLKTELEIYQSMKNEEVVYAISQLLFNYLDRETKSDLDKKTHEILEDRKEEYDKCRQLIFDGKYAEAKPILKKLTDLYEKLDSAKVQNYFDFEQMIDYILYCETVEKARTLNVKRYPEPVTHYFFEYANICLHENNYEEAIKYYEKALRFNPRSIYIMENLIDVYLETGQKELAFNLCKECLIYAYTKEQFGYLYNVLGDLFCEMKKYDIAVACLLVSDHFNKRLANKDKIASIVKAQGFIHFEDENAILSLFERENINYGPSRTLITTVNEFIDYLRQIKDVNGMKYLLTIMVELTEDEYYIRKLNIVNKGE